MLYRYLSLASISLPSLFVSLPGDSPNGGRLKEKSRMGEKWGYRACFSPRAKQSEAMGPNLHKFFIFANHFFLRPTLFLGTRGVCFETV